MGRLNIIVAIALAFIISMSLASAADFGFDNSKRYDPIKQEITITNLFGLGSEIAKVKLDTPLENYVMPGKDRLVAQFTVNNNYESYDNFLSQIKFYDVNRGDREIEKAITLKYAESVTNTRPTYEIKCNSRELENKTIVQDCSEVENGKEEYQTTVWHNFDEKSPLPKGEIIIGIFTDVGYYDKVEWIPEMFGVAINEWATWTSGLNVGLQDYWDMNVTSGTIIDRVKGRVNFTTATVGLACGTDGKVGDGLSQVSGCYAYNTANPLEINIGNDTNTIAFWYKRIGPVTADNLWIADFGNIGTSGAGDKGNVFVQHSNSLNAGKVAGWATFFNTGDVQLTQEDSVNDNNWHFYVQVRNSTGGVWMWKDGVRQATNLAYLTYNMSPQGNVYLFKRGATYVNGSLDELAIWNRSLSETEIVQLYNGGNGMTYNPTPAECWIDYAGTNTTIACSGANTTMILNNSKSLKVWTQNILDPSVTVYYPNGTIPFGYYGQNISLNYSISYTTLTSTISYSQANWTYSIFQNATNYNSTTYETASESFLTAATNITSASLVYDGTSYPATVSSGQVAVTIQVPLSSTLSNKSFYWSFNGGVANSSYLNQTVNPIFLNICNSTFLTTPFLNFTFKDESENRYINATIAASTFAYALSGQGTSKTLIYSNSTHNGQYAFCAYPNRTFITNGTVQYASSDSLSYPQRSYVLNANLTNATTNTILYLLASTDGIYSTYQIVNNGGSQIQGAHVVATRVVSGSTVVVGEGDTDSAGAITFFLNPNYDHTITVSKAGYVTTSVIVKPTNSVYTIIMSTTGSSNNTYISSIEGISWTRGPSVGVISPGIILFDYNVSDTHSRIINCSFDLFNATKDLIQSNSSVGTPSNCYVNMTRTVAFGDTLFGKYYVNLGNGSLLIESDGNWYTLYNPNDVSNFSIKGLLNYLSDDTVWTSGSSADEKVYEFTKFMFLFVIIAIVAAFLNLRTNFDIASPGYFLFLFPFILWALSIGWASGSHGFLYIQGATPFDFTDNIIVALYATLVAVTLYIRRQRGLQQ